MNSKILIDQFESEMVLPATWNVGGMGGYTNEYVKWLENMWLKEYLK